MYVTEVSFLVYKCYLSSRNTFEGCCSFQLLDSFDKDKMKQNFFQGHYVHEKRVHYVVLKIINTFTRQKKNTVNYMVTDCRF